jgi:hypothetical protein
MAAREQAAGRRMKGQARADQSLMPSDAENTSLADDVRYWHLADIDAASENVCFRGQSGHRWRTLKCLLLTQSGHAALFTRLQTIGSENDRIASLRSGVRCASASPDADE